MQIDNGQIYNYMLDEHTRQYEHFIHELESVNPQLSEQFTNILDSLSESIPYETSAMLIEGFRLGAKMMIEIYQGDYSD